MSRGGGVIRLLDQIKTYPFPNFSLWQILANLQECNLNTIQASMQRVSEQRKVKHATCKNVNGRVWRIQKQLETLMFLSWFRQVVLSYIHVEGHFNPRRVTVARVHGGLHPRRVHEEATLSIPSWPSPTKDLPHQRQIFKKQAISLPLQNPWFNSTIFVGGSQVTPSQSRRHHSPRSNKWCVDDELLALVPQMIVPPTLNSLSQDMDLVERRFEWK